MQTEKFDFEQLIKTYRCTNCGFATQVDEHMEQPMYNYCPYCGAKIRRESETR